MTPNCTNPTHMTSQPTATTPSTATLKRKGPSPNFEIPKLGRESSPPPLMSLSLTFHFHLLQKPPQQTHMSSSASPTIFLRKIVDDAQHHPTKA